MEKAEYQKHFELEESFWWFRGRRDVLLNVFRSRAAPRLPLIWLDAGCGTGLNMTVFAEFGPVFGCDFSTEALAYCRRRGLRNVLRADVQSLPYKDESFDAVSLLDVLYHKNIRNDVAALKDVCRTLKPGGWLLISDSAFSALRGPHDRAFHGRERYRKKTLSPRLEAAGFEILRLGYFNHFLFPLLVSVRWWERIRGEKRAAVKSDLKAVSPFLNSALYGLLKLEAVLAKKIDLPWGSSIVCLARKK